MDSILDGLALNLTKAPCIGRDGANRYIAELVDATGFHTVPLAVAWANALPDGAMIPPHVEFLMVPDHYRRNGYATVLLTRCRKVWPNLILTEPISPSGEKFTESLDESWLFDPPASGPTAAPKPPPTVYTASKTRHAWRWRELRDCGVRVNATWIDESGPGDSSDRPDLARRCIAEAAAAGFTLLYVEPGELLKGALVEVGAALAAGKRVRQVGQNESLSSVFSEHPNWSVHQDVASALRDGGVVV